MWVGSATHPNAAQVREPDHRDILQSPWRAKLVPGHIDGQLPHVVTSRSGAAVQRHLDKIFVVAEGECVVTGGQLHRLLVEAAC